MEGIGEVERRGTRGQAAREKGQKWKAAGELWIGLETQGRVGFPLCLLSVPSFPLLIRNCYVSKIN